MKKGIVIRAFSSSSDFLGNVSFLQDLDGYKRVFARAADLGFAGVQPYTEIEEGFISLKTPDTTLQAVCQAAKDAGIELPSLEIAPLQYSFTADDPAIRKEGLNVVRRSLDMAAVLGCKGALVIPGYVGLPWESGGGTPVNYEDAYNRTRDGLLELASHAEKVGVSIYVENIWNMFLLSPLEMRRLMQEVNSPAVGVLLDIGNVTLTGFAEQWIRILGAYLREVHLKDFRRNVGNVDGFVPLLAGDVNWPQVMAALKEIGFSGYLIPEIFPYAHFGATALTHVATTLDTLLSEEGLA